GRRRRVEGLAAHPERRRHFGDRLLVDAMAPEHLVLHLHAIPAIEELMAAKHLVADGIGVGMERAGRPERGDLGIGGGGRPAQGHRVKYNTSVHRQSVNEIMTYVCIVTSNLSQERSHETPSATGKEDEIALTYWTK